MRDKIKEKLIALAKRGSGVFTTSKAVRAGVSSRTLYRLRDKREIVAISRGVYQLAGQDSITPDYAALGQRVPNGVVCMISALYHHGLTTEIPREIHIAVSRNASVPKIDYPTVRIFRMSPGSFAAGVQQKEIGGVTMNIFSPEKTIADSFKYRERFGMDLAVEALKNYLSQPDSRPTKVLEMATICRVGTIIKPYLEALL